MVVSKLYKNNNNYNNNEISFNIYSLYNNN